MITVVRQKNKVNYGLLRSPAPPVSSLPGKRLVYLRIYCIAWVFSGKKIALAVPKLATSLHLCQYDNRDAITRGNDDNPPRRSDSVISQGRCGVYSSYTTATTRFEVQVQEV